LCLKGHRGFESLSLRQDPFQEHPKTSDILPCLGARPIAEIEAPELVAMANAIQDRGARRVLRERPVRSNTIGSLRIFLGIPLATPSFIA